MFSRYICSAIIPQNFRMATRISKYSGNSKQETWLDDYHVAVQIGGGNDDVAMKYLSFRRFCSSMVESVAPLLGGFALSVR